MAKSKPGALFDFYIANVWTKMESSDSHNLVAVFGCLAREFA